LSFLNELKAKANALQQEVSQNQLQRDVNIRSTEFAAKAAWLYVSDLAKQLNVITPDGPVLSLDGKSVWPKSKLLDFRADWRKKKLDNLEVIDSVSMGWRIVPVQGGALIGSVVADFLPELQRIESRLLSGAVKFERKQIKLPEKNGRTVIQFDYSTELRGYLNINAKHDEGALSFRMNNLKDFELTTQLVPAGDVNTKLLDELAKLLVGQSSTFL
jgi:hypothetical protein